MHTTPQVQSAKQSRNQRPKADSLVARQEGQQHKNVAINEDSNEVWTAVLDKPTGGVYWWNRQTGFSQTPPGPLQSQYIFLASLSHGNHGPKCIVLFVLTAFSRLFDTLLLGDLSAFEYYHCQSGQTTAVGSPKPGEMRPGAHFAVGQRMPAGKALLSMAAMGLMFGILGKIF